jgi:hypothetical protein
MTRTNFVGNGHEALTVGVDGGVVLFASSGLWRELCDGRLRHRRAERKLLTALLRNALAAPRVTGQRFRRSRPWVSGTGPADSAVVARFL